MKIPLRYLPVILSLACLLAARSFAQTAGYADTKEKVYLHTNHVFFKPGEDVFFKIYVVKGKDQRPSGESAIVKVSIINPAGVVVQQQQYQLTDGYAAGSWHFSEQANGGIYRIKAYTSWMQNEKDSTFFVKEITLQKLIAPRVLMKLDFPKKGYGAGDTVTADYAIRNLANQPISHYQVQYTVQIDGAVADSGSFVTDKEGKHRLRFRLPPTLRSNDGLLNITISYNAYTEAISRSIPITLNKVDLQFMPEGGTQVNGIAGKVAFRAVDEHGKPADIKGEVYDDNNNRVAVFESFKFGMGSFMLTPEQGRTYTAIITSPINNTQRFALPPAADKGIVLNMYREGGRLLAKLTASHEQEVWLTGQTRNVGYYSNHLRLKKGAQTVVVDESLFPAGIARFTVSNDRQLPLAERLCFLQVNSMLHVSIKTDKERYLPREKVSMSLHTLDDQGRPVPSNFSLAVVDDKLWTLADDKQDHIISWLLMSSELRGKIEEPTFYFKEGEEKAPAALDLVMLTHGYRYFDLIPEVKEKQRLRYMPQQQHILGGRVRNSKGEPVKAEVYLLESNKPDAKAISLETPDNGEFRFSGVTPGMHYLLIARPLQTDEKLTIYPTENTAADVNYMEERQLGRIDGIAPVPEVLAPVKETDKKSTAPDNLIELGKGDNKALNEVIVVGYGLNDKRALSAASVTVVKSQELYMPGNLGNLLNGRAAGVSVTPESNPAAASVITIRGNATLTGTNTPLFVVDGIPVDKTTLNINPNDIRYLEVLKAAAATALYGSRGANGVVLITTKQGRHAEIRFHLKKEHVYTTAFFTAAGTEYTVARNFYIPKYGSTATSERSDFRETIYWNPVVQTDRNGEAKLEFYNSDAATTFRAIAEGIGYNGKVGRAETTYAASNTINVDVKIPPYLTVGDKALLPLVISNNSPESQQVPVRLLLPEGMHAGSFPAVVTVPADSALQVLIPVTATAALNSTIRIITGKPGSRETLSLPITAAEKGFPVAEALSGNRSGRRSVRVHQMLPGTLKSSLKLYTDVTEGLAGDMAAMLREPYGCFEQTSSTTYPNIFILKFLKETGKTNHNIERKALDYIKAGYKRLISFETSQNGFEWFGHTPPHEALTAYGLMEFKDMQEFIEVDQRMLERTKAFLLQRRDGTGGFKHAPGAYHFAAAPEEMANMYIVYGMTRAGYGSEIQAEYRSAIGKAMGSNDGYRLGLAALAASYMQNGEDYARLMERLSACYQRNQLAASASVVGSKGNSLKVEVLALYALALMREKEQQTTLISEIITNILKCRRYYGYGGTQATVLALNAFTEYAKLLSSFAGSQVDFTLNGSVVKPDQDIHPLLKEGENILTAQYADEKKSVPYNLELSYQTLTPPNSPEAEIKLDTRLALNKARVGETVRMEVTLRNEKSDAQAMVIAKIGIPAGLSAQPWQLKELIDKEQVAYYELFDNYLVLYWRGFAAHENKSIRLDLKAEIPGTYKGKAGTAYLYYTPEHKHWNEGLTVEIQP